MSDQTTLNQAVKEAEKQSSLLSEEVQIESVDTSMELAELPDRTSTVNISSLPFDVDSSKWPKVALRHLRLENFGPHENVEIEFGKDNLYCLVGPNGNGKTTILSAIQALFGNFSGYEPDRYMAKMLTLVRNWMHMTPEEQAQADFLVEGVFEIKEPNGSPREYKVGLSRQKGFLGGHPGVVRFNLPHYCFMARFDQELHIFQVRRKRWELFKQLFEAVTGFEIEEDVPMLDGKPLSQTNDRKTQKTIEEYVQAFLVHKPRETIRHKQCSAGERKIAKSFSTILNRSVQPNIILIDNVTDHVELARHIPVIQSLEKCFPGSQVITTCHSQPVQRHLPNRDRIIDLRYIHCSALLRSQPWRQRMLDEINDSLDKIHSLPLSVTRERMESNAQKLLRWTAGETASGDMIGNDLLLQYVSTHLANVSAEFAKDVIANTPNPRIRTSKISD